MIIVFAALLPGQPPEAPPQQGVPPEGKDLGDDIGRQDVQCYGHHHIVIIIQ